MLNSKFSPLKLCSLYFILTINGQVIPNVPPPLVNAEYLDFIACDGTAKTNGKLFCNTPVENNCDATETIVSINYL